MIKAVYIFIGTFLFFSCVKKQLKDTTLKLTHPINQQVFHTNDSVLIKGTLSYKKKVNNIGFFIVIENDANDSIVFTRTILPIDTPYSIDEFYLNNFIAETHVTLNYGKRNVKTGQIYEIQELHLTFSP